MTSRDMVGHLLCDNGESTANCPCTLTRHTCYSFLRHRMRYRVLCTATAFGVLLIHPSPLRRRVSFLSFPKVNSTPLIPTPPNACRALLGFSFVFRSLSGAYPFHWLFHIRLQTSHISHSENETKPNNKPQTFVILCSLPLSEFLFSFHC